MKQREDFKVWLQTKRGLSLGSAQNYCSWLNSLEELLSKEAGEDICENFSAKVKKFNNLTSAFKAYKSFYFAQEDKDDSILEREEVIDEIRESETEEAALVPVMRESSKEPKPYDAADLRINFKLRLLTQDRYSDKLFLPIRLIAKLFNHSTTELKDSFYQWIDGEVEKIQCYTNNRGATATFFHVAPSGIDLIPYDKISIVDTDLSLYSPTKENADLNKPTIFKPAAVSELKFIHIDHTPLMKDTLANNLDKFTGLPVLTRMIKEDFPNVCQQSDLVSLGKEIFDNDALRKKYLEKTPLANILADLKIISDEWTLTLVLASFNLAKKKSEG